MAPKDREDVEEVDGMGNKPEDCSYDSEQLRSVEEKIWDLKMDEERLRSVFAASPDCIVIVDVNGKIVDCNMAVLETCGHSSKKELVGKSALAFVAEKDRQRAAEDFKTIFKDGSVKNGRLTLLDKNGRGYPVEISGSVVRDASGAPTGIVAIFRDVSERMKLEKELRLYSEKLEQLVEERTRKLLESEEALRTSEDKFRNLFENVPDGIYRSSRDGKIIAANPALVHMLGYESLDELVKVDIPRDLYVHAEDRKVWKERLENEGELRNAELVLRRKNGEKLVVLENTHVVRDEHGEILCYEGTLTDISERKMMEERLSALNLYGGKLNAAKTLDEVYELTLDAMEKTLGFGHASFLTVKNNKVRFEHQRGYAAPIGFELPLDGSKGGVTAKAAAIRKTVLLPDVSKDKDYINGGENAPPARSELAVPVIAEGEVVGVLNVENEKLNAFDEKDALLLEILASHAAVAISDLRRQAELEKRNAQQISLMRCSAEMIHSRELNQRLQAILDAIKGLGWRRVVLSVMDENLEIARPEDSVTAGLTEDEKNFLWRNRQPGSVWEERFGLEFERFRIGEFFYLPWSDPWVQQKFSKGTVSSHLKPEEMVDWNPDDLLYAPLRLADGRIVGVVSIDDPEDGRRPTKESLMPLELFLHQAAVAIENARLIQQLDSARAQILEYAGELEVKVEDRTKELVEAQKRLLKAERLAAIGELAGMVGHDLRNPLTGIAGAAYFLKAKYASKLDERGKEMLGIIEKDIDYSNKIINDLLEYSREVKLELTETNPRTISEEVLSQVRVPRRVRIVDRTEDEPKFRVDVKKMLRVFTNIIKNAVDAMPKGGTLTIRSMKSNGKVVFSFSDTGIGMSEETLNKLWIPLFTTKAKGMGFGLPVCKRFVEGHGGKISVESVEGEGSTFTVTLPLEPRVEKEKAEEVWVNMPESVLSEWMGQ